MLGKEDGAGEVQLLLQLGLDPNLVFDPEGDGFKEGPKARGCVSQKRMQDAVELNKRLLVEDDVIQLRAGQTALAQAELDGVPGIALVVLAAGKAFLLRRRQDFTVADQAGGAIVVVSRDA